jgi:ribosomal protein S18 acetylase RimI-like enzyme
VNVEVRLGTCDDLDGAALVWARATAARDGDPDVAPLQAARAVLLGSLGEEGSILVVAVADGRIIGFATAEPATAAETAEIRYLGVDPDHWRDGIGQRILALTVKQLATAGFLSAQLLVYEDNHRARRLYEGAGWTLAGDELSLHPRSGRLEIRYHQDLRA